MTSALAIDLTGRRALVTGAQQGIGAAIALALGKAGADVAINYLDDAAAAGRVAEAIRGFGRRAAIVQGDVGSPERAAAIVAAADAALGGLDVLVNNAGVFPRVAFVDMTEADWDHVMDVNLKGGFFAAQAAVKLMMARGTPGAVINLASQAVRGSSPRGVHYAASKGGVVSMTRAMALELAPFGIRVNAIAPGLTDTAQPRYGSDEAELAAMAAAIPLGRMAQPADIAGMAAFLASDLAAFMTGQTVHVNGGTYMP
jgi:NAD(P)-dependent dehydrogenase (short-subunit alcohol dehydrogenase family)